MAAPRRIQPTALSSHARFPFPTVPSTPDVTGQPCKPTPAAEATPFTPATTRVELILFEPDDQGCPEFSYHDLITKKTTEQKKLQSLDQQTEDKERQEIEALARTLEEKYGKGGPGKKKDRIQDLVDIGFGYDESDSFIDNSEAYDELVPACLTTRYGGFYINSGTLQFRAASDEGENEFGENEIQRKKRKLKEGTLKNAGKKTTNDDLQTKNADDNDKKNSTPDKSSTKKSKKPLHIDKLLKKFHKEKLRQLQMFTARERETQAVVDISSSMQSDCQEPADPLLTLIGSTSADDLLQAVTATEQDFDLDEFLEEPQNISPDEIGDSLASENGLELCSDALPPTLEQEIQEMTLAVQNTEGQNKLEILSSQVNKFLLEMEKNSKQLGGNVISRLFSNLATQLNCSKATLVNKAKQLHSLKQDEQLHDLLRKLEEAVARSMPEQISRFQDHCQAHSEAKAAKLEAEKEQRVMDGSDEEEEEKSGKRVFGPRKRFRWNDEVRELLCELVHLKMAFYDSESESSACGSLEDFLKSFLEADVKPLWPKGWMQSRLLLIETRKAHGHITGVVARKKTVGSIKLKKVSVSTEGSRNSPEVPPAHKRKRLSLPGNNMQPEVAATAKTPSNTPTVSTQAANQLHDKASKHLFPTNADGVSSVQMMWTESGLDSELKPLHMEKNVSKLTLVAAPDGARDNGPSLVQGVARLMTTTRGDVPTSLTAAAGEISCGNPALPTPSLSLVPSSYSSTLQTGVVPGFAPLHALPFPGLSAGSKLPGQTQAIQGTGVSAQNSFQHGLALGSSMLGSSDLHLLSLPVSFPAPLHTLAPWLFGLDGSLMHPDGANVQRQLH